jgi:hypothetical protein
MKFNKGPRAGRHANHTRTSGMSLLLLSSYSRCPSAEHPPHPPPAASPVHADAANPDASKRQALVLGIRNTPAECEPKPSSFPTQGDIGIHPSRCIEHRGKSSGLRGWSDWGIAGREQHPKGPCSQNNQCLLMEVGTMC